MVRTVGFEESGQPEAGRYKEIKIDEEFRGWSLIFRIEAGSLFYRSTSKRLRNQETIFILISWTVQSDRVVTVVFF